MMSHHAADMPGVENPAKRLGESVGRVDDSRDVAHFNVSSSFPVLDGKVLDVNVTGAISGNLVVDHKNSRHVILVDRRRGGLLETKVSENHT